MGIEDAKFSHVGGAGRSEAGGDGDGDASDAAYLLLLTLVTGLSTAPSPLSRNRRNGLHAARVSGSPGRQVEARTGAGDARPRIVPKVAVEGWGGGS